jgi:geranylgeranyl reductase family protein
VSIDAIVVGAGPAGSVAAVCLARAGARVRLLDRAAFPRHKLCGDTLNPGSLAILERLNAAEAIRRSALRITGMLVTGPAGAAVAADYPNNLCALALGRLDLDQMLVKVATAEGVEFEPGVMVQAPAFSDDGRQVNGVRIANGGRQQVIRAPVVIAADGRGSRLASALRLARFAQSPRRWAYGAYFEGVDGLTARGEMHIRGGGYIGVAPLPGGLANVCVVNTPAAGVAAFDRVIADAIAADAGLRERFRRARRVSAVTVLGPLAVEARASGCPGMLLAGDAAGFVDPMTGDGIRFALRGGELAAEAALRELQSGQPSHLSLAVDRRREFAGKWRINRALRALVGSPRGLDLVAAVARRWAAPVQYMIGVAGDVSLANRACRRPS